MKPNSSIILAALAGFAATCLTTLPAAGQEAARASTSEACEDAITAVATLDPKLDSDFFRSVQTSYPWHIVEGDDGSLEDTFDQSIDAEDLQRIEHTADCMSTHQGEHKMSFCDARATSSGVKLVISGGMPAYASSLIVTIDAGLHFHCSFNAAYPDRTAPLKWRITRKSLQLRRKSLQAGTRCDARIFVEFEEITPETGDKTFHKIEGWVKPVIQGKKS